MQRHLNVNPGDGKKGKKVGGEGGLYSMGRKGNIRGRKKEANGKGRGNKCESCLA